jgi:phage terminase large subunit-like protein
MCFAIIEFCFDKGMAIKSPRQFRGFFAFMTEKRSNIPNYMEKKKKPPKDVFFGGFIRREGFNEVPVVRSGCR